MMAVLRVFKMRPDAIVPHYKTEGAAGMDLAACLDAPVVVEPGRMVRIPTGLKIALPPDHEGQVRPRSGLAANHGVTVLNAPGTIDEDYRGEVQVILVNHGSDALTIAHGDRVAQLVVAPVSRVQVQTVDDESALGSTRRGQGGFGSTGA